MLQRAGGLASVFFLCVVGLVAAMGDESIMSMRRQGVSEKAECETACPLFAAAKIDDEIDSSKSFGLPNPGHSMTRS